MQSLDVAALKQQISNILLKYPELKDDQELLDGSLEGETDIKTVCRSLIFKMQIAESYVIGIKATHEALSIRKQRYEHRSDAFRDALQSILETANLSKLELPEATLSLRAMPVSVVILEEKNIPTKYFITKTVTSLDKKMILDDLKNNINVLGVAKSNSGQTISIRVK